VTAGEGLREVSSSATPAADVRLDEIVICSLEAWDDVWRRNQFLVDALLQRQTRLRVLFVEPPTDVLFDALSRRRPIPPRLSKIRADGRLRAFRPLKAVPRRFGRFADNALLTQVQLVTRVIGLRNPVLWINDVTYAPLIDRTGWGSIYDVTDDWLLAPFAPNEIQRLRRLDSLAIREVDEVVVCSEALAKTRGALRAVTLVPNGVDVEHFRKQRTRPHDLPETPVAVYVGSLHDARLDVDLVLELADSLPGLTIALVGPDVLDQSARAQLAQRRNIALLGRRPYEDVPAYLQHADVVIVPHRVSDFSATLDPLKLYECLVIETPTVATPVAGFRDHADALVVADRSAFVACVRKVLAVGGMPRTRVMPPTWIDRAKVFEQVLARAAQHGR
jgi:teichuronic acid biosynthesis glycosyltransferase TuaH